MLKRFLVCLFLVFPACNFSDEVINLSGGWSFIIEGEHDKVISYGDKFIPCEVTYYGYNDDFIIATQKPTERCFFSTDTILYSEGKNKTYYWLIVHKDSLTLGPMNKIEFEEARIKYKVPEDLELESTE